MMRLHRSPMWRLRLGMCIRIMRLPPQGGHGTQPRAHALNTTANVVSKMGLCWRPPRIIRKPRRGACVMWCIIFLFFEITRYYFAIEGAISPRGRAPRQVK